MSLREAFPQPTPVTIGGAQYWGYPLRLRDLAVFEVLAATSLPDPEDGLGPEPVDTYPDRLRTAFDQALAGPPEWGSPACSRVMGTVAAGVYFLQSVFRMGDRDDDARRLIPLMTVADWAAVRRIAYGEGHDPARVERLIDVHLGIAFDESTPVEGLSWSEAAASVCVTLGKTPAEVAGMTLPEVRFILGRGRKAEYAESLPADGELADRVSLARAEFWKGWTAVPYNA